MSDTPEVICQPIFAGDVIAPAHRLADDLVSAVGNEPRVGACRVYGVPVARTCPPGSVDDGVGGCSGTAARLMGAHDIDLMLSGCKMHARPTTCPLVTIMIITANVTIVGVVADATMAPPCDGHPVVVLLRHRRKKDTSIPPDMTPKRKTSRSSREKADGE